MIRVCFNWPFHAAYPYTPHPFWFTGQTGDGDYLTMVAYSDTPASFFREWPLASRADWTECEGYTFSDRFPKPSWLTLGPNDRIV